MITQKECNKDIGLCDSNHAIAKGIKQFSCLRCGGNGYKLVNGVDYCEACRKEMNICAICGREL